MILIFIIVTLLKLSVADKDTVPVFMIDYERVMGYLVVDPNPFSKMTTAYFADIIQDSIKRSDVIIIFVEDSFCVEDVSSKDMQGSPYKSLHQGLKDNYVKFFPGVVEPYQLLRQILKPGNINTFYLNSGEKFQEIFDGYYKYLYVYFEDGRNETRTQALRRHDTTMREVSQVVRQKTRGSVIAFYTGKMNPVDVEKIEYVTIAPYKKPQEPGVLVESKSALYMFIGISMENALRSARFNQAPSVAGEYWTDQKLTSKLAYTDFELEFNFSFGLDGWLLDEVGLIEGGEEVGRTQMGVGAPWNWAYYCGEPLMITNKRDGSSVFISQYQIQPFHTHLLKKKIKRHPYETIGLQDETTDSTDTADVSVNDTSDGNSTNTTGKCFGQTVNCGPYFNTRILSCLFVTAICLGIMAFGLIMLFDCNPNNSYDDPHNKPLVIGAEH